MALLIYPFISVFSSLYPAGAGLGRGENVKRLSILKLSTPSLTLPLLGRGDY